MKNTELLERVAKLRHIALDMDGTIYLGKNLFPCTRPFLALLDELGIGYSFLTNNPTKSIDDYIVRLEGMGLTASAEQIYTTSLGVIDLLRSQHPEYKRLFILGTQSMTAEFERAGFISLPDSADEVPDAVIASFDMSLEYSRLCRTAWWVKQGVPYFATNPDRVCPTDQPTVLVDCGAICAAIETATGRKPDIIVGKPNPDILRGVAARKGVAIEEVAMVGDRLYTDVATAHNAGAFGILTLSGETTAAEAAVADPQPHLIINDLSDLGALLRQAHSK